MLATDLRAPRAGPRVLRSTTRSPPAAGSIGALAAGLPALVRARLGRRARRSALVPGARCPVAIAGAAVARSLSPAVEPDAVDAGAARRRVLGRRGRSSCVWPGLFAVDSFARRVHGAAPSSPTGSPTASTRRPRPSASFFAMVGVLQTLSFLAAGRLGRAVRAAAHDGGHPPAVQRAARRRWRSRRASPIAVVLLLARDALSQMDVPTRQAYVMALVSPAERTAAAATTNSARYVTRPSAPRSAASSQSVAHRRAVRDRGVDQERLRRRAVALVPHRPARRRGAVA